MVYAIEDDSILLTNDEGKMGAVMDFVLDQPETEKFTWNSKDHFPKKKKAGKKKRKRRRRSSRGKPRKKGGRKGTKKKDKRKRKKTSNKRGSKAPQ